MCIRDSIKEGSLHRANGGYLVVDALTVLTRPFAWEALKRALREAQTVSYTHLDVYKRQVPLWLCRIDKPSV